ncbi:putative coiled coil [Cryptosporidium sp. chipmunk genotype I]|uniref:putative coiled coil n=1 Tax=Cryptosporidium sp. chipmunk genotype I TaxID=1280935 RepID=UPI00351AA83B|nr:putative coiled coil [Cryptosporidium sp. chipmunk genotype I]
MTKRLLRPVESEEKLNEELPRPSEESNSYFWTKKKLNKSKFGVPHEIVDQISWKKEKRRGGTGVLGTLIDSIMEEDTQNFEDSESESIPEVDEQLKTSKTKKVAKKRKKKGTESIDLANLLSSLNNTTSKQKPKKNKTNRDLDAMFESISIPSSETDNNSGSKIDDFEVMNLESNLVGRKVTKDIHDNTSEEDYEFLNLTEIEMALRKCVKSDYNPSLELNEWLPTQCIDARSEVARQMDDDVEINEITEKHEFFYSQWIEQIGYLSSLTKGFTRSIQDCFVREGQILSISSVKESNPELLLDPEDKILITVQNSDACVVLNRLVNIANSQEKLLIDMSKETGMSNIEEVDSTIRLKYGVISLKARAKLWWFCRMAEHCGLVGKEGSNMIKYYVLDKSRKKTSDSMLSTNADIISSTDPTMDLFNKNDSDSNREDEFEEDHGETEKIGEMDSKWLDISSIKISNKTRPWEKRLKKVETKPLETKSPRDEESTSNGSKKELFKFMLKNLGPRPIWTKTSIVGDLYNNEKSSIEIEPPTDLSLREQGQLKIKWLQMKSQAEKLATHHFKIINPETKDLDHDSLKYWCKLFKVNLLFPPCKTDKIRRVGKSDRINSNVPLENNPAMAEVLEDLKSSKYEDDQKSSAFGYLKNVDETKRNSLPLDVEFVSDISESDVEVTEENGQEYDHGSEGEAEVTEVNQVDVSNYYETDKKLIDDTNEYHSAEEVFKHELDRKAESDKEGNVEESKENVNSEDEANLEMRKEAYRKLKAIRRNRRRFKKKIMEKYGHLFENEAEESDDDGVKILKKGIGGVDSDDDDDDGDIDWDELSGFSDFIDDNNYEDGELDGDAIQAHLKHMKQIEEKQYRQLFTLDGIKERKNKVYGFAADQDDGIEGETRLEKKKNEMLFNSAFFDDDVISEFWTDEEELNDYEEEIDEKNLTEMLGLDYEEWQNSLPKKVNSPDESLNEQRKLKYNILKESLIKEASASINILKQRLKSIQTKLSVDDNISPEEKNQLKIKYLECMEKLKKLLHSIHSACNKCIYENPQFFDHINIYEYIQKRQESKNQKKLKAKSTNEEKIKLKSKYQNNYLRENVNPLSNIGKLASDSEDEIINRKKLQKNGKNIVNVKGGRFIISRK